MDCDFSTANEKIVYPEGKYHVITDGWEETKAATGTMQIKWKMRILSGDYIGKSYTEFFALTDAALWRLINFAGMCIDVSKLTTSNVEVGSKSFYGILNDCKNRKLFLQIGHDTYNGVKKNVVLGYEADPDNDNNPNVSDDTPAFLKEDA